MKWSYISSGALIFQIVLVSFEIRFVIKSYAFKDICMKNDVIEGIKSIKYLSWELRM